MTELVALTAILVVGSEVASFEPRYLGAEPKASPHRIVTVAPSVTELIFALGAGERVVGVSIYDDHPPSVHRLPRVGGFLDPNVEAIVALSPSLVIGVPNAGNRSALERVSRMGIPVLVVPGNTFSDIFFAIRSVSRALGPQEAAFGHELEAKIRRALESFKAQVKGRPAPRVAIVYGWNPLILAGPGSFADTLLVELGARNIAAVGPQYPHFSVEQILQKDPHVIIDASEQHGSGAPSWKKWTTVSAVKSGRVHRASLDALMRPGPRIIDGMRKLVGWLHPKR